MRVSKADLVIIKLFSRRYLLACRLDFVRCIRSHHAGTILVGAETIGLEIVRWNWSPTRSWCRWCRRQSGPRAGRRRNHRGRCWWKLYAHSLSGVPLSTKVSRQSILGYIHGSSLSAEGVQATNSMWRKTQTIILSRFSRRVGILPTSCVWLYWSEMCRIVYWLVL